MSSANDEIVGRSSSPYGVAITILTVAAPVVLANISQTLMGLVDTMMVGRLGTEALAAVGLATLIFSAGAMSLKSIDTAVQSFTARRCGQGREGEVGSIVATGLTVVLAAGCVLAVAGFLGRHGLMAAVSGDAEVRRLGADYLVWRYAGLLPFLAFFIFRGAFDGIGLTAIGMVVGIGMNVANVVLNWVLIFGHFGAPAMGVGGAALASSLSSLLAATAIIGIALWPGVRRRYRLLARDNLDFSLVGPFLRIAWPPTIQVLGSLVAVLIFFFILGRISTTAVAAGNIVLRIASLSFMPGVGVGVAAQTLVGQALGRGDPRGAVRFGWGSAAVAVAIMGAIGVLFLAIPRQIMFLFTPIETVAVAGTPVLRLMGLIQVIDAVGLSLAGVLRGGGALRTVMLVDIVTAYGLLPLCAWFFGIHLGGGLLGAWGGLLLWFSAYAVGMVWLFLRGDWKEIEL